MRTQFVNLTYPPEKVSNVLDMANPAEPEVSARSCTLSLIVDDERKDKTRIGFIPSGFWGQTETPVLTDDSASVWVRDAIERELSLFNYIVIDQNLRGSKYKNREHLNIVLTNVEAGCRNPCDADISFEAILSNSDAELRRAEFTGSEGKFAFFSGIERSMDVALSRALQETIYLMMLDLGYGADSQCPEVKSMANPYPN